MLNELLPLLLIVVLGVASQQFRQRRAVRRMRRQLDNFDGERTGPALEQYCALIQRAFGAKWTEEPPPALSLTGTPDEVLSEAVRAAALRFGVPVESLRWSFVPQTVWEGAAGCVLGVATHRIEMRGHTAVVTALSPRTEPWRIEIANRFRDDPEVIAVIAAHEVAHVALASRGIGLIQTQANEELVDAAAALAGFGPLMLQVAARERVWRQGRKMYMRRGVVGYLNRPALAYVWDRYVGVAS